MKSLNFIFLTTFLFSKFLFCIDIFLKNDYKTDEEKNIINERVLTIDNLKINYKVVFNKDERKPIRKKWGDFFLGCEFGRRGNGGWDIWNFLSVLVKKDGKILDLVRENLVKNIYILEKTENRGIAEIYWEGESTLSVKILKYKDIKNWFFIKIETNIPIEKVSFSAYPGETTGPPERERWCGFQNGFYNLHKEEGKMKGNDFYVILFNKYGGYQDRYGNFLVFLHEEVNDCKVRGTYGVGIEIIPKKDIKEMRFALGYFYDENRDEVIKDFINNKSKEIYQKLLSIDWNPIFDFSSFKNILKEIDELSEKEGVKPVIEEYEYRKLKEEGEKYIKEGNYRKMMDIYEKMVELKEKIYEKILFLYK